MRNEWTHTEDGNRVINDNAPEEAKANYKKYLQQLADIDRRTKRTLVIPKNQVGVDDYENNDADWSKRSYETEDLIVFNILFDEYCLIRERLPNENYLEESSRKLYDIEIIRYFSLLQDRSIKVPQLISVLKQALDYHTFVEYVEEHII